MTGPVRVPQDSAAPIRDHLRSFLGSRGESATTDLAMPSSWSPVTDAPFVHVLNLPGPLVWPVLTQPPVHIAVYANGRTEARRIAALCQGRLLMVPTPGVAQVRAATSIVDDRDSKTGAIVAGFDVNTKVRTGLI